MVWEPLSATPATGADLLSEALPISPMPPEYHKHSPGEPNWGLRQEEDPGTEQWMHITLRCRQGNLMKKSVGICLLPPHMHMWCHFFVGGVGGGGGGLQRFRFRWGAPSVNVW